MGYLLDLVQDELEAAASSDMALSARRATPTELADLRQLVAWLRTAEPHRWTDADEAEAIEVGSRDVEAALVSLRALKDEHDHKWAGFTLDALPGTP